MYHSDKLEYQAWLREWAYVQGAMAIFSPGPLGYPDWDTYVAWSLPGPEGLTKGRAGLNERDAAAGRRERTPSAAIPKLK